MSPIIPRVLSLPDFKKNSAFLWGPRKTGKSFWIREHLPNAPRIDLLESDTFAQYAARPQLLRERYSETKQFPIVIDEVQKVPALLDEVQWLIENRKQTFLLTGSSARKLRRGHANLLAGRAWRREMRPLCFAEVPDLNLEATMLSGLLPPHYLSESPLEELRAYISDYLKEEIAAEGVVQNLPSFSEFLRVAAITNSEILDYTNVGREAGASPKVVRRYFDILEDTLLGFRLPPWRKSKTRRMILTEKFFFFDVGVTNYLARREPHLGTPEFGKSFEHFILLELLAYRSYRNPELELSYWRTSGGEEVDFVLNDKEVALEVKSSARLHEGSWKGLSAIGEDGPVKKRLLVSLEKEPRWIQDAHGKVHIQPWKQFLSQLWKGEIV